MIRTACVDDAAAIARVHVATWRAAYRGQIADAHLDALDERQRAERWRAILGDPASASTTWVAAPDDIVAGFVSAGAYRGGGLPAGAGEIWALYVAPERWGAGIGAQLLRHAVEEERAAGRAAVALWVLATNARARRFYERAGFVHDGATKREVIGGVSVEEIRYLLP